MSSLYVRTVVFLTLVSTRTIDQKGSQEDEFGQGLFLSSDQHISSTSRFVKIPFYQIHFRVKLLF